MFAALAAVNVQGLQRRSLQGQAPGASQFGVPDGKKTGRPINIYFPQTQRFSDTKSRAGEQPDQAGKTQSPDASQLAGGLHQSGYFRSGVKMHCSTTVRRA